eukprot:6748617-Alexandrium_andersonii.AAC.1
MRSTAAELRSSAPARLRNEVGGLLDWPRARAHAQRLHGLMLGGSWIGARRFTLPRLRTPSGLALGGRYG